jgi:signal transduction histidine kinase
MSPVYCQNARCCLAGSWRTDGAALIRRIESGLVLLVASFSLLAADPTAAAVETRNVLVLYSNSRLTPGNIEVDRGLSEGFATTGAPDVRLFYEFLDRPYFGGDAYESTVTTYLREKYSAQPLDAIVAVSENALDFLLRKRAMLFPRVPVVYVYVYKSQLATLPSLPVDVVGVPVELDFLATIQLALRWHPAATRLVIVTGTSVRDRELEARLRREVPPALGSTKVEFLAGRSTTAVLKRLGELGPDSVVFTPGYFQDADGNLSSPRDSVASMARAATVPVYGPLDTFIGTGVVGGWTPSFEDMGRQAAQIIAQLFAGAAPSSLRLPEVAPTALRVDWRQVRRWGIDENAIPAEALVYFREPTFWQVYQKEAIIGGAVILLQAALIAMLLLEHRRRRQAESAVHAQRGELWHASRRAVAGELTASIAHEINQPLGAILTNADAGELLLQSGTDRREDLRRILSDIRRDDMRASDVIRRLRALLAKHDPERQAFEPGETVADVMNLLGSEAQRRRVTLSLNSAAPVSRVIGDRIQIQQVLINLTLNAMDAVEDVAEDRRIVEVSVKHTTDEVRITVRDRGHGIAPENLSRLFDSFFSTKQRGMGLGLSIARTIVESHGGRIWAANGPGFGASFHVELPVHGEQRTSTAARP